MHTPTHPQAVVAVFLASHHDMPRDCVARELHITRTPRPLYTLARVLRAAQIMDEINAAPADIAEHLEISGALPKAA